MKVLNGFLGVIMAIFAILQWNDPDGLLWIFIYGYVAVMAGMTFFNVRLRWFLLAGMVGLMVGIIVYIPDFIDWIKAGTPSVTGSMKAESPFVELVREFLGLCIAMLVMIYLYFFETSSVGKKK